MEIRFLKTEEVMAVHRHQIDEFGGQHGLRSESLLLSAIAQPSASFGCEYLCRDLFEMAAAYLFHFVKNHPFLDGNKRVALHSALIFLHLNGWRVRMDEDAFYEITMNAAQSLIDKPTIANLLRAHSERMGEL
jgi:death-on-curing protein